MDAAAATRDNRGLAEGDRRLRCEPLATGTGPPPGRIVDTDPAWIGDPRIAARIRHRFESRRRTMTGNGLRQTDVPAKATPIAATRGAAPGPIRPVGGEAVHALPGAPRGIGLPNPLRKTPPQDRGRG